MKSFLHLCDTKGKSIITQIIDYDIYKFKGDTLIYYRDFYSQLDENLQELFVKSGFIIGEYKVIESYTEENGTLGFLRILFISVK